MNEVKSIFIEIPTWLGDAIMTTPAIQNLINTYPYISRRYITIVHKCRHIFRQRTDHIRERTHDPVNYLCPCCIPILNKRNRLSIRVDCIRNLDTAIATWTFSSVECFTKENRSKSVQVTFNSVFQGSNL